MEVLNLVMSSYGTEPVDRWASVPGNNVIPSSTKEVWLIDSIKTFAMHWLLPDFQVIVYDHGQVIEDPALIGRVNFTGRSVFVFV